jgi:lysophospholipase L1-like esterase
MNAAGASLVGWVERSETHRCRDAMGFAFGSTHPTYLRVVAAVLVLAFVFASAPTHAFDPRSLDRIRTNGFESTTPTPMPLVSRQRPAFASSGNAAAVDDGEYYGGATWDVVPSQAAPAWVAIHLSAGPARAMLNWVAYPGSNLPTDYRIETSANSTNGADGGWTTVVSVVDNAVEARAHPFAFAGRQWVRLVVTRALAAGQAISIDEIDVQDASAGNSDSWMFVGDSITAAAFHRGLFEGNFPERVHAFAPDFFPLMIGAGVGGTSTVDGVAHIDEWLALHPHMQNWVISYGTNDSANADPQFAPAFGERLRYIVATLKAAGKTVFVPRIPYKTGGESYLASYNAQVDAVCSEFSLGAAPDLYAWFIAHQAQLYDGVHPNDDGSRAMNQLWADAVRPLYP